MDDLSFGSEPPTQQPSSTGSQALRHLTIRQIYDTRFEQNYSRSINEGNPLYYLNENQFKWVTLVAHVIDAEITSNRVCLQLEDGTGRITASRWLNEEEGETETYDDKDMAALHNKYIRVYGWPDRFNGRVSLKLGQFRQLENIHELFFHILEAMYETLHFTRGPPERDGVYRQSSQKQKSPSSAGSSQSQSLTQSQLVPVSTGSSSALSDEDSVLLLNTSDDSNDSELEDLRRELEGISTPPSHKHHALCKCKPAEFSSTPFPFSSTHCSSAHRSPARRLRSDPYSECTALERSIILLIIEMDAGEEEGASFVSIAEAMKVSDYPDANANTIDTAVENLLAKRIIETVHDDLHLRITRRSAPYPTL